VSELEVALSEQRLYYRFLKPKGREILFLDTTDPIYIQETLDRVDFDRSHFFIISKSGRTIGQYHY